MQLSSFPFSGMCHGHADFVSQTYYNMYTLYMRCERG